MKKTASPVAIVLLPLVVLTVAALGMETGARAQTSVSPDARVSDFANPPAADRPMYRFWNTGGLMTEASIAEQVAQIKAAGAGGFEANQLAGIPPMKTVAPGYVAARHGFGTPEWTRAWTQLFKAGKAAGLRVDQLYTPGWSAGIQGLSPDGPGTAKEIVFGSAFLNAGQIFAGPLPTASLPAEVTRRALLGVIAYRCDANCSGDLQSVPVLDPASARNVTATVVNSEIRYTAPADAGKYVLVAAWMQGTGQTIELASTPTTSYMVDHYASSGAKAIVDYWETKVLTPDLRKTLKASAGSLFFDSLELNREGVEVRHWTDDFLAQFEKRRGYSLVPYLAAVSVSTKPVFEFGGGVGERVREDYRQTLSDLLIENHIIPIRQWAHSYRMSLRGQGYEGWGPVALNNTDAAIAVDIPEQEANNRGNPLFAVNESDAWRQVASANAQVGRTIVSSETGTFGRTDGLARISLVARINETIGLGMNKVVYHGWPDQSPGAASAWPGNFPFRNGVGDNYGVQIPTFSDDVTINDYVGRLQTVIRRGALRNDVALYWGGVGAAHYDDLALERAGYSYGFMTDTLVSHPSATLKRGELTNLGYRAFVLDGQKSGIPMSLSSARRILSWARAGFPVVVVGTLPERTGGYHLNEDAALRKVFADLLVQKSVIRVADSAAVVGALNKAGINSAASYTASPLVTLHRQSPDSEYYYLFNAGAGRTKASVSLTGKGDPYRYDAWTGAVRRIGLYTRTATGVQLDVDLATGDSALIALTNGNKDVSQSRSANYATATTGDEILTGPAASLLLRATKPGTYVTTLDDGKKVESAIPTVGVRIVPASWTLDVTSWRAGPAGPNDTAKVALAPVTLSPGGNGVLPNWQMITGLSDKSGTSTYTTTVDTGSGWTGGTGATLDLGSVLGTAQVSVNGRRLPPLDQTDMSRIDLGGYLRPGVNRLQVHIATPVYNAAYKTKSPYGLVGPVVLTPYGQAEIPTGKATH
jgi:hypothetical protein